MPKVIRGGSSDRPSKQNPCLRHGADAERRHPHGLDFGELYLESYDRVCGYARLRMGDDPYVEDVVSEAYLRAARSFDSFDPTRAKFSTWVIKILINVIVDHWRRENVTTALEDAPMAAFAVPDQTDEVDDHELVAQLLSVLSPEEADLVMMKYQDGKRNVDIAAELGLNPSTVASRLFAAIHKMRAASEGE